MRRQASAISPCFHIESKTVESLPGYNFVRLEYRRGRQRLLILTCFPSDRKPTAHRIKVCCTRWKPERSTTDVTEQQTHPLAREPLISVYAKSFSSWRLSDGSESQLINLSEFHPTRLRRCEAVDESVRILMSPLTIYGVCLTMSFPWKKTISS